MVVENGISMINVDNVKDGLRFDDLYLYMLISICLIGPERRNTLLRQWLCVAMVRSMVLVAYWSLFYFVVLNLYRIVLQ